VVTFAVTGGIFGVGRLAARLDELSESGRIGAWHIGPWVDWRQTAIRIKFDSVEDGKLSEHVVRLTLQGAPLVAGPATPPAREQAGAGVKKYFHALTLLCLALPAAVPFGQL
jgi:hypothetical protein